MCLTFCFILFFSTIISAATAAVATTATTSSSSSSSSGSPNIECLLCPIYCSVLFGYVNSFNLQMIVITAIVVIHFYSHKQDNWSTDWLDVNSYKVSA